MPFGLGGSSSKQKSSSEASSSSYGYDVSGSYLDPQQAANQQWLTQQFQNQYPQMGQTPWLDQRQKTAQQGMARSAEGLNRFADNVGQAAGFGMDQMRQFAQQGNPYLEAQISGLQQDAGRMFREELLPGIGSGASMAGQRGSSRQGIAEGLAAGRTADAFLQGANDLRFQTYGQQQQAAGQLMGMQGLANQAQGMAGNMYGSYGALANQNAQTGMQSQMMPFQIGASIIGQPATLQSSLSEDFATAQSKSKGKGGSSSLNLGFG